MSSVSASLFADRIARELQLAPRGVTAALELLDEGGTVPFIARYRKEQTGALDEVQIRLIEEHRVKLTALEARRTAVLSAIEEQQALTPEIRAAIEAATTKAQLEDLYLPFKKKRRTRAMVARERGLLPLANLILAQRPGGDAFRDAAQWVNAKREVPDAAAALAGASDIIAEIIADTPAAREQVRRRVAAGDLGAKATSAAKKQKTKFEQYYEFSEPVSKIPSHRYLALCRGEAEGALRVRLQIDDAAAESELARLMRLNRRSAFASTLSQAISDSLKRLIKPSVETEVRGLRRENAERAAVDVFAENLKNLLLAPPLGAKPVLGIDPGLRTGCKLAVLDHTGQFVTNTTLFLSSGEKDLKRAETELLKLVRSQRPLALAVGNGTGGREAEAWLKKVLQAASIDGVTVVSVSEAGASVYSASEIARSEFPQLDLTVRGAISIGRRLQDPLSELVKVDPKAIGVGQYQHDVNQTLLGSKLSEVVASCVNRVGVDVNTASAALLSHVAGIGPKLAQQIVEHRNSAGPFLSRTEIKKVKGLGPRAFEQCAGFLRIHNPKQPLDGSAIHPERYSLVRQMAADLGVPLKKLVGDPALAGSIVLNKYVDEKAATPIGLPTLEDIIFELKQPGRDPRESFEAPKFRDDVHALTDLKPGMALEGVVTNVTAFGAFVDLGVHQDGLVHISQLADRFVKDPNEIVKAGQKVQVRVVSVELERKRIALTMRSGSFN